MGASDVVVTTQGDAMDLSGRDFACARSMASNQWAEKGLRLLNNLYMESPDLRTLLRGEVSVFVGGRGARRCSIMLDRLVGTAFERRGADTRVSLLWPSQVSPSVAGGINAQKHKSSQNLEMLDELVQVRGMHW